MVRVARRHVAGYTLVQLLVVMLIIAILMGLIIAAVQKVRSSGDRVVCINNLGQISKGILSFHDANDRFPVYNGIGTPVRTTSGQYDVSQGANRKSVYGSYLTHSLPFMQEKELYNGIRAETDRYTNTGSVLQVIPGTPAVAGKAAIPGTPEVPASPGTPAIPGSPGTPDIPATSGVLISGYVAAVAAVYSYEGLIYLEYLPPEYNYDNLVYKPATPTEYNYDGLEYRTATPPTYDLWNAQKQLVDYYVGDYSQSNGVVVWEKKSKWVPDQFPDPWSNKPAGYYRISDNTGPVNPPVKTAAKPAGYYRISDGTGPVSPPISKPARVAGWYRAIDLYGPVSPILISPYIPAKLAVWDPPPTPFIPGKPPTPDIPATPPTEYQPAVPGVPAVPGIPAGPPTFVYSGTFKKEFKGYPVSIFRCPSDPSVMTDPEIDTPGKVYTATMGVHGAWTSTNYIANWNVMAVPNATLGYKSPPSTIDQVSDGVSNTVLLAEAYAWCDGKGRTAFVAWHETDPAGGPNGGLSVGGVHNFGLTYGLTNNVIQAGDRPGVGVLAPNGYPNPYKPPAPSTTPELIFEYQIQPKPLAFAKCPWGQECCVAFSVQSGHAGGLNAATADGAVHILRHGVRLDVWRSLLLPRDGKAFATEW